MSLLLLGAMYASDRWQDLGRLLTDSVLDVYGRIMETYKDLKPRAAQMLIVVAKDIEEGLCRFSQDHMKGRVQPGFPENPRQGRFDQNAGRK